MKRASIALMAVALALGFTVLWWLLTERRAAEEAQPMILANETAETTAQGQDAEIDVSRVVEMTLGKPDAPVTIVEYLSFTCPHCATFNQTVFRQVLERYVEPGTVRIVTREVFFDAPGLWAALVARCGGPERYHGIVDLLFAEQSTWARAEPAPGQSQAEAIAAALRRVGRRAGLTDAELDACLSDRALALALLETYRRNATADGITATPTFVINGRRYSNMSFAEFEAAIQAALEN